jgi:putative FmdB family regulatory protein
MPIFEYRCTKCGNHFEKLQKGDALQRNECPKCHSPEVTRELSSFSSASSRESCGSGNSGGG